MLKKLLLASVFFVPFYTGASGGAHLASSSYSSDAFKNELLKVTTLEEYKKLKEKYKAQKFQIHELLLERDARKLTTAFHFIRKNISNRDPSFFLILAAMTLDGAYSPENQKQLTIAVSGRDDLFAIISGGPNAMTIAESIASTIHNASQFKGEYMYQDKDIAHLASMATADNTAGSGGLTTTDSSPKVKLKNNLGGARMNQADNESEEDNQISDGLVKPAKKNEESKPAHVFSVKRMLIAGGLVAGIAVLYKYLNQEDEKDNKGVAANK